MDPVIELKNAISRSTREAARKWDVCEVLENVTISVGDLQSLVDFQTKKWVDQLYLKNHLFMPPLDHDPNPAFTVPRA